MIGPFTPIQQQIDHFFPPQMHPYRRLEALIDRHLTSKTRVLEIGCGHDAPLLTRLSGKAGALFGVDVVNFDPGITNQEINLINTSVSDLSMFPDNSIDLAISRSVMEHIEDVDSALSEIFRVLQSTGKYIFLTPNKYDYASLIATILPNRFHAAVVELVEGRPRIDTFPTYYRANSFRDIRLHSDKVGFDLELFQRLNQYPSYLSFSRPLFWLGCHYERLVNRFRVLDGLKGWILCVLSKSSSGSSENGAADAKWS